ncbi:unnamed protein product [Cuscuta europaea]|uniref:Uncharacterized protein n=1 Tax=Cuscuta europaea TaxID=41803 RepID=A0A9P0ZF47_CUSEU|nr:unnamed protein product [Cuscuta europaea]
MPGTLTVLPFPGSNLYDYEALSRSMQPETLPYTMMDIDIYCYNDSITGSSMVECGEEKGGDCWQRSWRLSLGIYPQNYSDVFLIDSKEYFEIS